MISDGTEEPLFFALVLWDAKSGCGHQFAYVDYAKSCKIPFPLIPIQNSVTILILLYYVQQHSHDYTSTVHPPGFRSNVPNT